jgi:hypothetical protein
MPKCTHKSCKRNQWSKGLCEFHYNRRRRGTPLDAPVDKRHDYTASSFAGAGVVCCHLCGGPVVEHSITEPCDG